MSKQTEINDDVIREQLISKLKVDADDFYEQLVVNRPRGEMPEGMFVNYFLPYLTGVMEVPEDKAILSEWVSIAGSPTAEINIVDDVTGEVLYIAPSLYDTGIIDTVDREPGQSFGDIFSQYELQLKALPIVAGRYLNGELSKKLSEVNEANIGSINSILTWDSILERYNYLKKTTALVDTDVDIDITYD